MKHQFTVSVLPPIVPSRVVIGGIEMANGVDYTVNGNVITVTEAGAKRCALVPLAGTRRSRPR